MLRVATIRVAKEKTLPLHYWMASVLIKHLADRTMVGLVLQSAQGSRSQAASCSTC